MTPKVKYKIYNILKYLSITWLIFITAFYAFPLPKLPSYSSVVYDSKMQPLHIYLTPDDKWRMEASLQEISPLLRKTIISKEDQYFYYHPGINPIAVARALVNNLLRGRRTSGASTITMQVARMLQPRSRTLPNKLIESWRAIQLEYRFSKAQILQLYLNMAPYGGNIEGVKTAAHFYLGKHPNHLSLAEVTALSIIPNNPNGLRPGKKNEAIVQERNHWLQYFKDKAIFSNQLLQDALQEPFDAYRRAPPRKAPHFSRMVHKIGQEVYSSLDMQMQAQTEALITGYMHQLKPLNINNCAVLVIDNKTGKILSYAGSANFLDTLDGGQVDGIKAIRQPGSTLKPLINALAFDVGIITPKSLVTDVPINLHGYTPENYDQKFNGLITSSYALGHSLNIPAVNLLRSVTLPVAIQAFADAGCLQIAKDRKKLGYSMVLGGCGASLYELVGVYAMLANGGQYQPISFDTLPPLQRQRIVSPMSAYMVTNILSHLQRPDFPLNWSATENLPKLAWKTGTSYGRRDAWSIGYNTQYTVGIWVGNFSGQGIPELSGASVATPLLFKIFNAIDYKNTGAWFTQPAGLETRDVCALSGLLPTNECDHKVVDFYMPLVSSMATCNLHQLMSVSTNQDISYCNYCRPENGYKNLVYSNISNEVAEFMTQNGQSIQLPPPHNPQCKKQVQSNAPNILQPSNGSTIYISKQNPEPVQLQCQASSQTTRVFWYINNKLLRSALPSEKIYFSPTAGRNAITCANQLGQSNTINIQVEMADY